MQPDSTIPYGFCHCGCGERTKIATHSDRRDGQIKGEPFRYVRGHHRRKSPVMYIIDEATGCWEWQRAKDSHGYGQIRINGRLCMAHQYIYEQLVGPVPEGLELDHLCRNPPCVNPQHLEPVTHKVNLARGTKPFRPNKYKTHCPHGHEYTPDNLRGGQPNGERSCKTCQRLYAREKRKQILAKQLPAIFI